MAGTRVATIAPELALKQFQRIRDALCGCSTNLRRVASPSKRTGARDRLNPTREGDRHADPSTEIAARDRGHCMGDGVSPIRGGLFDGAVVAAPFLIIQYDKPSGAPQCPL
jgi:hypothetical protein